jgi:dihydrodipicolinate synthase/N-acetylneuraminate lyase
MSIDGPIFAIVTPFDQDDNVDKISLITYLAFLEKAGVKAIVVNGTTGEFSSLTFKEKIKIFEITKKHFKGKIISHISSCSYYEANQLAKLSVGADALLILPPYYYNIQNRTGLVEFFRKALEGISIPTYLYNFPFHTKIDLSKQDVIEICEACGSIVGLKDSGGDLNKSKEFNEISDDFDVFVGKDKSALNVLEIGLKGSVTGAGNPFPEFLVSLWKSWKSGNHQLAIEIQHKFDTWNTLRDKLKGYEISIIKENRRFPNNYKKPFN